MPGRTGHAILGHVLRAVVPGLGSCDSLAEFCLSQTTFGVLHMYVQFGYYILGCWGYKIESVQEETTRMDQSFEIMLMLGFVEGPGDFRRH